MPVPKGKLVLLFLLDPGVPLRLAALVALVAHRRYERLTPAVGVDPVAASASAPEVAS